MTFGKRCASPSFFFSSSTSVQFGGRVIGKLYPLQSPFALTLLQTLYTRPRSMARANHWFRSNKTYTFQFSIAANAGLRLTMLRATPARKDFEMLRFYYVLTSTSQTGHCIYWFKAFFTFIFETFELPNGRDIGVVVKVQHIKTLGHQFDRLCIP